MRIVAIADTHLLHASFAVPDGDVLVHAGDLCRQGDLTELRIAADWLASLPHHHKVVVAGNHDWAFARTPTGARALIAAVPGAVYLEDCETAIDGLRFYGSPWQPAYRDWAFNLPRGAPLATMWAGIPPALDVLVTHGPPAGLGDRHARVERSGCANLRARVRDVRPRVHLFGHVHQDGGVWTEHGTLFANVTTAECTRGATVIDLDASTAIVVHAPPRG